MLSEVSSQLTAIFLPTISLLDSFNLVILHPDHSLAHSLVHSLTQSFIYPLTRSHKHTFSLYLSVCLSMYRVILLPVSITDKSDFINAVDDKMSNTKIAFILYLKTIIKARGKKKGSRLLK